jgi:electron transfer flavoprotein alpha subunit
VANLLVMMEFFRGELLPASLEALGQARRLGTAFGLSVYALVPLPSAPDSGGDEDLTARCGRYGADKVVMLTGEGLQSESEMRFAGYAGALLAACAQLPPRMLMLGDTPAARDIAPRLASRLGAAFLPRGAALELDGELVFCDESGNHVAVDAEPLLIEGMPPPPPPPVLLTVPPGRFPLAAGTQDAEMLIVAAADSVPTSDATPVAAAGFAEEALDALPLASRLVGVGQAAAEPAVPALWRVSASSAGAPASFDSAHCHIALGPDADQALWADYALTVPDAEIAATGAALLKQLALPAPPKPVVKRLSPSGFGELSHLTPTGEFDGWGNGDITLTGDTDTTREVAAVAAPAPRVHEEPARASTPAKGASPAKSPAPAAPVVVDPGMWEGFATPPTPRLGDPSGFRGDGAPQFELETADTAPVAIVAPAGELGGSAPVRVVPSSGPPIVRRGMDAKPASPRRAAPSSQSPARGRGPAPRKPKDAKDSHSKTAGLPSGPDDGQTGDADSGRTEEP